MIDNLLVEAVNKELADVDAAKTSLTAATEALNEAKSVVASKQTDVDSATAEVNTQAAEAKTAIRALIDQLEAVSAGL